MTETKTQEKPSTSQRSDSATKDPLSETQEKNRKAADAVDLTDNALFSVPGVVGKVRTAEDAREAFLREEISEDELRAVLAANGHTSIPLAVSKPGLERGDEPFHRDLPEDLLEAEPTSVPSLDERLEMLNEKQEEREKAQKAADEVTKADELTPALRDAKNEAGREAVEGEEGSQTNEKK